MRLLTLLILSMWSNTAAAETGKFTFLGLNQCAPFEGILFDPTATANMLTEVQIAKQQCGIQITYELGKQATEYELQLQNLIKRNDALTKQYDTSLESLKRENNALSEALKKQSKTNPALWVVLGVASGMAISYGAYKVFDD